MMSTIKCEKKKFRLDTPIYENKVRFVCISDTHEKLEEILPFIPKGLKFSFETSKNASDFRRCSYSCRYVYILQNKNSETTNDRNQCVLYTYNTHF